MLQYSQTTGFDIVYLGEVEMACRKSELDTHIRDNYQ